MFWKDFLYICWSWLPALEHGKIEENTVNSGIFNGWGDKGIGSIVAAWVQCVSLNCFAPLRRCAAPVGTCALCFLCYCAAALLLGCAALLRCCFLAPVRCCAAALLLGFACASALLRCCAAALLFGCSCAGALLRCCGAALLL